ncbi:hypothetical protein LINPERHAP2_LOCUS32658 [Linum perenne]
MAAPIFEFDADVVAESQQRNSTSLLARLFLPNPKSRQWLQATLGRKWNLKPADFRVSDAGFNLYQFYFAKKTDLDRVMRRRPHSIDGCPVNLMSWMTPSTEVFNELRFATFWVRLEDVPVGFRSLQFGSGLLQPVGQVLHTGLYDSPSENKELIRGFMNIDVTQPLLGRRKARFSNGGEFWVRFGFEGLPTVCFGCGMLGHSLRQCSAPFADGSSAEDRGSWMQAEKLTYHPVKTVGKKRSAEAPGSGGVTASTAATVSSDPKRQRLEMSADGLGLAQAQLGASTSLGRISVSAPQPLQAPNQPISGSASLLIAS